MKKGIHLIGATIALLASTGTWALEPAEERDILAQQAVAALASAKDFSAVQQQLTRHPDGLQFASFLDATGNAPSTRAISEYHMDTSEVWLHQGTDGGEPVYIAFRPAGNETSWTHIPAYDLNGNKVSLDVDKEPTESVLVVENRGGLSLMRNVELANEYLREHGLQRVLAETQEKSFDRFSFESDKGSTRASVTTTRLDRIRLSDDMEPWISGKAEVYAITAGVFDHNNANIHIIGMPYLDHDDTTYYPRQIILDWRNYDYAAANILLYEQDDNTNYQDLLVVIVNAVGQLGSLAGYPAVTAIATITSTIIEAIPSSFFSNDDDFVDAYYTIEKDRSYYGLRGAGNNANSDWVRYILQSN